MDFHVPYLTRGEPMPELEELFLLARRELQLIEHVLLRESVEVGDSEARELFARVAVKVRGGRVRLDDSSRGGIDQQLNRTIPLENLSEKIVLPERALFTDLADGNASWCDLWA
jgi:hypothetical protein